jgi:hypothetical protein
MTIARKWNAKIKFKDTFKVDFIVLYKPFSVRLASKIRVALHLQKKTISNILHGYQK